MPSTGTPASNTHGSHRGEPSVSTDAGPPERMMPRGAIAADVLRGQVRPVDFAVDAQLAHPPGDELRVLAAEVEDQHPLRMNVHHTLPAGAR